MSAQLMDVSSLPADVVAMLKAKLAGTPSLTEKPAGKHGKKPAAKQAPTEVLGAALQTDRAGLVTDGHKILGVGMTATRIAYGLRVLSWARANNAKNNGQRKAITELGKSIINEGKQQSAELTGKKNISLRALEETVRLTVLATFVPDVGKLDWNIATNFIRFLDGFKPATPEVLKLDECKALLRRVLARDAALFGENGAPDRKAIREAINDILGISRAKSEASEDGEDGEADEETDGVTSVVCVAKWVESADAPALESLRKLLSADVIARVADALVQ